ncbi:MAG: hypothetical protein K8U57_28030 [Planctomycetes bacterium]|nr:hypothetical protein [Planctomycetota bacterium]
MSTIACPGCGLPREEQLANSPCPVCDAGPAVATATALVTKTPAGRDPTTGLPSDVGEMNRSATTREGFPAWFGWVAVFLFGLVTGVGSLLAWQASRPQPTPPVDASRLASNEPRQLPPLPLPQTTGKRVEVAPMPHDPKPPPEPEPEPPLPEPKVTPVAPDRVVIIELNSPNANYSLPFSMKKGERVILKGKVNRFTATSLDAGAVLDASGLEAAQVYIGGRIDNGSVLKVNCPSGKVTVAAAVFGKSIVEINALGGDVIFSAATTPTRPGSTIDGGSSVTITSRTAELRGDINGSNTKVMVNIPSTGTLKVVAIRGTAAVEYRVTGGKGLPEVSAEFVSPAASFKKLN